MQSAVASPPPPTPGLILGGALIFMVAGGNLKKLRRAFAVMRVWIVVRRSLARTLTFRDRSFDEATELACDEALVWLDRTADLMLKITPHFSEEAVEEAIKRYG